MKSPLKRGQDEPPIAATNYKRADGEAYCRRLPPLLCGSTWFVSPPCPYIGGRIGVELADRTTLELRTLLCLAIDRHTETRSDGGREQSPTHFTNLRFATWGRPPHVARCPKTVPDCWRLGAGPGQTVPPRECFRRSSLCGARKKARRYSLRSPLRSQRPIVGAEFVEFSTVS
jgi:hypothetical protein